MQFFTKFAEAKVRLFSQFAKKRPMKLRFFLTLFSLAVCTVLSAQNKGTDLRLNTLVIDAGHGGKDPGAVSPDKKTYEKTLTLKISKKLAEKVREAYPEMNVSLTRSNDTFVELMNRAKYASNKDAQLFISIHINASAKSRSANGFSVYVLGQSSKSNKDTYALNMEVLKRENSVIYLEDDATKYQEYDASPESRIMMQLMSNAFREQSLLFAQMLNDNMKGPFRKNIGVHQDNFCVLRLASMPAVLIELGFITNSDDLALLRSEESLDKMVENMFKAFKQYKTVYDASVSTGEPMPTPVITETETTTEEIIETVVEPDTVADDVISYGTQILATSKLMNEGDRYFKGNSFKAIRVGNLYKYVIGISSDKEEAKKFYNKIKSSYPDSFFVKISDGAVTREM